MSLDFQLIKHLQISQMIDLINLLSRPEMVDLEEEEGEGREETEVLIEVTEEATEVIEEVIVPGEEAIVQEEEEAQEEGHLHMLKRENQGMRIVKALKKHDLRHNNGWLSHSEGTEEEENIDSIRITDRESMMMMGIINLIGLSIKERMRMLRVPTKKNASNTKPKNPFPPKSP